MVSYSREAEERGYNKLAPCSTGGALVNSNNNICCVCAGEILLVGLLPHHDVVLV